MIDINEILGHYGILLTEKLVNDIQNKLIKRQGLKRSFSSVVNASGALERSITYTVEGSTLTIWGNDYIYYLQNGRKPGKAPPFSVIRQWVEDKGIETEDKDSLAWAIVALIAKEGTTIYKAGGSNLVSGIFDEALQQTIENEFAGLLASEIESEILQIAE